MMMMNRNINPRRLFNHCLINLPEAIIGIRLNNIRNRGTISSKSNADIEIIMENCSVSTLSYKNGWKIHNIGNDDHIPKQFKNEMDFK